MVDLDLTTGFSELTIHYDLVIADAFNSATDTASRYTHRCVSPCALNAGKTIGSAKKKTGRREVTEDIVFGLIPGSRWLTRGGMGLVQECF